MNHTYSQIECKTRLTILSSKDIMEDMEDNKNEALESVVLKVIPHDNETSKEILYDEANKKDNSPRQTPTEYKRGHITQDK
jgi:hypothetical protein